MKGSLPTVYKDFNTIISQYPVKPKEYEAPSQKASESKMQININLDGDVLKKTIEQRAEKEIIEETKKQIKEAIFKPSYSYSYSSSKGNLDDWIINYIKEVIRENKDQIIEAAARDLADSMRRSKPVRERFCDYLQEELNQ